MRYFFECGSFFDFSHAELSLVFESFGISKDCIHKVSDKILLVENKSITLSQLDEIFSRLGGFIRYGEIIDDLDSFLNPYFERKKVTYGISILGESNLTVKDTQRLANEIKRGFRSSNIGVRFILPKQRELNAAQIFNNKVLENGFELCISENNNENMYGKTLGIQDIYSFVKRDTQRPGADYEMGVLPQKLARIMCNFTGFKEGIIWDPFCGSGTILMEAAVLGFDILGTDIDLIALESLSKNIQWLSNERLIKDVKYNIFQLDINNVERKVLKDLKRTPISAIVCEPFMGPPQKRLLTDFQARELIDDVSNLYNSFFKVINQITRKGFKVVLVLPSYRTRKGWVDINISQFIDKKWDVLNRKYTKGDLKWKRINSIIARNIFILEKR
jgi:tRNA G10  N-methylase Trm11